MRVGAKQRSKCKIIIFNKKQICNRNSNEFPRSSLSFLDTIVSVFQTWRHTY